MRLVVHLGEMLPVEVGVDLGGADAGVAEHFLHRPQVARRLQHMGGERVAQHVRVNVLAQARLQGPAVEPQLHAARGEAGAALADEEGGRVGARQRQPVRQPGGNRGQGLLSHRHDAGLVALAGDLRFARLQVEVVEIEPDQFRQAQAGRIEQLEHGAVACQQGIVGCRRRAAVEQLGAGIGRQDLRQGLGRFGRAQAGAGVVRKAEPAAGKDVKPAPARQLPRHAGGRQVLAAQLDDGAADVGHAEFGQRLAGGQLAQVGQVALIGRDRMRRQPPFGGEVLQIGRDRVQPCIRTSAAPTSWLRRSR